MKIIVLKKGDKLVQSIVSRLDGQRSGLVVAIGALNWAILKVYDLETKTYSEKRIEGPLEIASFSAVIAQGVDGIISIHPHIVVSNKDFNCMGGHLEEAEVGATAEVVIMEDHELIKRVFNEEIGLNLLNI